MNLIRAYRGSSRTKHADKHQPTEKKRFHKRHDEMIECGEIVFIDSFPSNTQHLSSPRHLDQFFVLKIRNLREFHILCESQLHSLEVYFYAAKPNLLYSKET